MPRGLGVSRLVVLCSNLVKPPMLGNVSGMPECIVQSRPRGLPHDLFRDRDDGLLCGAQGTCGHGVESYLVVGSCNSPFVVGGPSLPIQQL